MARPKKKPNYDAEQVLRDLIAAVSESYDSPVADGEHKSLKLVAEELEITPLKVRKLLITAGAYKTPASMHQYCLADGVASINIKNPGMVDNSFRSVYNNIRC